MFRRVNNNKFGVIEYAIDSEEDLLDLPREDTNNAVYAILRKDGKKLVYLYSKEIKDYILINGDLEEINVKIENINEQLDTSMKEVKNVTNKPINIHKNTLDITLFSIFHLLHFNFFFINILIV